MASREQVESATARIFGAGRVEGVMAVLDLYGVEAWQLERERVQLAVLRLCDDPARGGDWARLREGIEAARTDWRDVLLWAECPRQASLSVDAARVDLAGYRAAIEADRREYEVAERTGIVTGSVFWVGRGNRILTCGLPTNRRSGLPHSLQGVLPLNYPRTVDFIASEA